MEKVIDAESEFAEFARQAQIEVENHAKTHQQKKFDTTPKKKRGRKKKLYLVSASDDIYMTKSEMEEFGIPFFG